MSDDLVSVKVEGIQALVKKLGFLERHANRALEPVVQNSAERLREALKASAPVLTGAYRDSIRAERSRSGIFRTSVSWNVTSDSPYAARLVLGYIGTDSLGRHYNEPPVHPWAPYIEAERLQLQEDLEGKLEDMIKNG